MAVVGHARPGFYAEEAERLAGEAAKVESAEAAQVLMAAAQMQATLELASAVHRLQVEGLTTRPG